MHQDSLERHCKKLPTDSHDIMVIWLRDRDETAVKVHIMVKNMEVVVAL